MSYGDERGLIYSIAERPEDDLPRMLYADLMEERGEEWKARYIRKSLAKPYREQWYRYRHPSTWGKGRWEVWDGHVGSTPPLADFHTGVAAKKLGEWRLDCLPAVDGIVVCLMRGAVCHLSCPTWFFLSNGPRIVSYVPVTSVLLQDRRPHHLNANSLYYYIGSPPEPGRSDFDREDCLPWELRPHLPGEVLERGDFLGYVRGVSENYMRGIVSRACVDWARHKVGLPAIVRQDRAKV